MSPETADVLLAIMTIAFAALSVALLAENVRLAWLWIRRGRTTGIKRVASPTVGRGPSKP